MPSTKSKKHPSKKTASSSSPSSSSSNLTPNREDADFNEENHHQSIVSALESASLKYPSLIGNTAFIGRVFCTEDDTDSVVLGSTRGGGCKVWLSQSSMVTSSIIPGSTVSVSLASLGKKFSSSSPLSSLSDECERHFRFDSMDDVVNEVGNYFAIATVFPSCKVLKNGVRFSSSLSCTMGCPASGRIVFVYPIHSQCMAGLMNGNDKLHSNAVSYCSLYNCKELYLSPVSSGSGSTMKSTMFTQSHFPAETTHTQAGNGKISSPTTPLQSQSKLSSSNTSQLTSPRYDESVANSLNPYATSFDVLNIGELFGDESAKKLLQTCFTSWLCSRNLLRGNLVVIPILSKLFIFQVLGANINIQNLKDESAYDLFPQAPDLGEHVDGAFFVDRETKVYLYPSLGSALKTPQAGLPHLELECEDIKTDAGADCSKLGGLAKEYGILKDIIVSSSVKCTLSSLGLRPTKGVLLHGPPGTGKTSLVRLCVHDAGVNLFSVNGPETISQYYGESEQALHELFDSASRSAPAVVFIDELDAIAPARKDGSEELSQRMVATLLNLMDGISRTDGLLVIAATNRPESIDHALRRPGRLDREIEIGVPSPKQRHDIMLALLSEMKHSLSDMQVQNLAMATHGFVGADLASLCNEAALVCLRRFVDITSSFGDSHCNRSIAYNDCSTSEMEGSDCLQNTGNLKLAENLEPSSFSTSGLTVLPEILNEVNLTMNRTCVAEEHILRVGYEDFEKARMKIRPSAMREVILEVPKVSWEDVGGQKEVKMQLMEAVEWPQKYQDAFKRIGTCPPTGVLMFGPPGCSKTLLARAVASEAGLNFLAVKGPELFSKWVGESEKAVRSVFAKARANAPSIIFIDEIDGLAVIRGKESDGVSVSDRVMSQLLVELDGLHERVNVTVIAATNRPDKIDPALLRPGRFDRLLYVGPPSEKDREEIFHIHLHKMPCCSDVCIKELALLTEGCTGADISLICREAAVAAIEESLDASEITMKHLRTAIKQVQPSEIQSYQELSSKFQRLVHSDATRDDFGC